MLTSPGGQEWALGILSPETTSPHGFYVAVALLLDVASSEPLYVWIEVALLLGIAFLAFLGALALGHFFIRRPVAELVRAAERWRTGDWNARVKHVNGTAELAKLATAFNQMALAVAHRQSELLHAKEEAEQATRTKSMFLANMSHELRTPLNAILGFSDVIGQAMFGPIDRRYREYAIDIHRSGEHLLALVNDILDLSKVEADRLELEEAEVEIGSVIEECVALMKSKSAPPGFHIGINTGEASRLRADPIRLRQIIINLLGNAVKFTPADGAVAIKAYREHGDLVVEIADTGPGMTEEQLEVARQVYGQVAVIASQVAGTGLGIPIADRLTRLHGGRLELSSARGIGTVARVILPASRVIEREHADA